MQYKTYQLDLQSGDVILYRNEFQITRPITWLATLIRWILGSQWNHCGIIVHNWHQPFISESLGSGVITRPLQQHLARKKSRILVLRSTGCTWNERRICTRANSMLGVKYDRSSLVIYQLWFLITGHWIGKTKKAAAGKMTCSEYAAWCHDLPIWWQFTPKDFINSKNFRIIFSEL